MTQSPAIEEIPTPDHLDGHAYLYGHPLLNSLSPLLHKTIYDALGLRWEQFPLSRSDTTAATYPPPYTLSPPIPAFLSHIRANERFVGSSVTMPYKVAILPHLDRLTEEARGVGACNTIFLERDGEGRKLLVGTNSDCIGVREALLRNLPEGVSGNPYEGKPALIVGGGGTARAAVYAFRTWLKVSRIYIVNRDEGEVEAILQEDAARRKTLHESAGSNQPAPLIHVVSPEAVQGLEPPVAVMSGVPNYPPVTETELNARRTVEAFFKAGGGNGALKPVVLEMCYHPHAWTEIAQLASDNGCHVVLGSEAMIWQGIEQARLWTGRDIVGTPGVVDKVEQVIQGTIKKREDQRRAVAAKL
ncbi:hypothetical protein KEM55_002333 [Ascosphaera atra]|nr:hypothetical protein KEM55_002333 [Ascosphaera atra]